jgi:hypothetical protein
MPCLLALLIVLFPRIAVLVLYLLTTFFNNVYDTILIPVLGFIFMPITLIAYTWLAKTHAVVDATYIVVILIAVVLDLGLLGGGEMRRRRG